MHAPDNDSEDYARVAVGRTALGLVPLVFVARGVGFLIPVVIADLFGASSVTDAFFFALAFPMVVLVVITQAIATVLMPILAETHKQAPAEVPRVVGGAATVTMLLSVVVGLLLVVALQPTVGQLTTFDANTQALTVRFLLALVPFMGLTGASAILRAACNVHARFAQTAVAPIPRAVTTLALLLALPASGLVLPLALGVGALAETLWLLGTLSLAGVVPVATLRLDRRLQQTAWDAAPVLLGQALVALHLIIDRSFAGSLPLGSVSLLEYADRVRLVPQTLLEGSLVPVAFATWSHLWARGETERYAAQLDQSLRWMAAWTAAPLAGLFIGRYVLIGLLFERGAFTAADTAVAGQAFGIYVPGLWVMMLGALAMKAHVVEHRLMPVLVLGVLSVTLKLAGNAVLVGPLELMGLCLASTLVWAVVGGAWLFGVRHTLARAFSWRQWAPVIGVAAGSLGVAMAVEGLGAPRSLLAPTLWVAALACFGLLGLAMATTRPPAKDGG